VGSDPFYKNDLPLVIDGGNQPIFNHANFGNPGLIATPQHDIRCHPANAIPDG